MYTKKEKLEKFLQNANVKYTSISDRALRIVFSAKNLSSVEIICSFNEGMTSVKVLCYSIASFKNKEKIGYKLCNNLNKKYRWLRFYIDKDSDFIVDSDIDSENDDMGVVCAFIIAKMAEIIDEIYPDIMKSLWGE